MTPAEADWIAATVLTRRYLDSCGGITLIRLCPCQYGACGHCTQLGQHNHCTTRAGWNGNPPADPDTHVVNRRGGAVANVWLSGTPCRWRCACDCPTPEPAPLEVRADAPTQLDIFAALTVNAAS